MSLRPLSDTSFGLVEQIKTIVKHSLFEELQMRIANGDIRVYTYDGAVLLHYCVLYQNLDMIEFALKNGADPNIPYFYDNKDRMEILPLVFAVYMYEPTIIKTLDIVKSLLQYGANPMLKSSPNMFTRQHISAYELSKKNRFDYLTLKFIDAIKPLSYRHYRYGLANPKTTRRKSSNKR